MNLLRRYFYWTYERGSFHYDVMVTFILAFIFITPHLWNYKDKPVEMRPLQASEVLVKDDGRGGFIYDLRGADLQNAHTDADMRNAIFRVIEPISGEVQIDRYEPIADANGKTGMYRVWVHK